mgnify:CR=1 FL=1
MQLEQKQIDALEKWIEDRRTAYLLKGFSLAANAGVEELVAYKEVAELLPEDAAKPLSELKAELDAAEEFYKDARAHLFAGRQGG